MRLREGVITALVLLILVPEGLTQSSGDQPKMSAREVFYAAPRVKKKAPRPPAPLAPPAPAPVPPARVPLQADRPEFIPATMIDPPRLGLRCSVLKREGASDLIEVDPDVVFRSGDRIRLRVQSNDDGHLYVILRGSSGVWKPLFPSKEVDGGSNRIVGGQSYDIPKGHVFTFDDQPGDEKLFVILSRTPVADLDSLIYDLGTGAPAERPAKIPSMAPKPEMLLLAQNLVNINDSLVNRLRNAHARDLIIEKVDDSSPSAAYGMENAVYAVATAVNSDSRVVVDLTLMHR